jgi:hypothetical protein
MTEVTYGPLSTWPGPRTPASARRRSPFSAAWSTTTIELDRELHYLAARRAVIELDLEDRWFRLDGLPRANAPQPADPGVVLSLPDTKHGPLRYSCDAFTRWQDNFRAIVLGLESLLVSVAAEICFQPAYCSPRLGPGARPARARPARRSGLPRRPHRRPGRHRARTQGPNAQPPRRRRRPRRLPRRDPAGLHHAHRRTSMINAPPRSLDQRLAALEHANHVRLQRAELKRLVRHEPSLAVFQIRQPAPWSAGMRVEELLGAVPYAGPVLVHRWFIAAGVSWRKTLGGLTQRQRDALEQAVQHWLDVQARNSRRVGRSAA